MGHTYLANISLGAYYVLFANVVRDVSQELEKLQVIFKTRKTKLREVRLSMGVAFK